MSRQVFGPPGMIQDDCMATVDRAHRIGFALIPALVGGLGIVALCAVAGASSELWMWLGAVASGAWGYRYACRWATESTGLPSRRGDRRATPARD